MSNHPRRRPALGPFRRRAYGASTWPNLTKQQRQIALRQRDPESIEGREATHRAGWRFRVTHRTKVGQ